MAIQIVEFSREIDVWPKTNILMYIQREILYFVNNRQAELLQVGIFSSYIYLHENVMTKKVGN